ncbi:peptidoglycan-binding protein [Streptomyces sp. NPDC020719]|uniref:peptidoglycan-binding protein n=1 Tax=Streptomyces sp. NPDC020719 TaxID=3154896 RepID=UPI0033C697FB
MTVRELPEFEEYEPGGACGCPGCAERRRSAAAPLRAGGHPAAHGARRAIVLATAAGVVLSGGAGAAVAGGGVGAPDAVPGRPGPTPHDRSLDGDGATGADEEPVTAQGATSALHGSPGVGGLTPPRRLLPMTRADIVNRAKKWVTAQVPYSMDEYWSDGYRQDCSGFVSMAWNLGTNEWTGSLASFAVRITKDELQPGDMLLFHNPDNPTRGSHVVLFGGWTDYTHTYYVAYEQTPPNARKQATPYAYWSNSTRYLPYRYKSVSNGSSGAVPATAPDGAPDKATPDKATPDKATPDKPSAAFPGAGFFGPGANNSHVTRLGQMLVARGGKRFYTEGPGPRWGDADRRATEAFQRAQGWSGAEADGLPGPDTWSLLVKGTGKDIPAARTPATATPASLVTAPDYPGARYFRPGQSSTYVTELGRRLVRLGFGRYYTTGPGPDWEEADRRNVEAFQRAQGWRGAEADGYPGPETWRRLFA